MQRGGYQEKRWFVWEWGLQGGCKFKATQGCRLCRTKETLMARVGKGPRDQLIQSHFTGRESET